MECIECKGKTKTTNSVKEYGTVYRKRVCLECKKEFFTYEIDITEPHALKMCKKALASRYRKDKR